MRLFKTIYLYLLLLHNFWQLKLISHVNSRPLRTRLIRVHQFRMATILISHYSLLILLLTILTDIIRHSQIALSVCHCIYIAIIAGASLVHFYRRWARTLSLVCHLDFSTTDLNSLRYVLLFSWSTFLLNRYGGEPLATRAFSTDQPLGSTHYSCIAMVR